MAIHFTEFVQLERDGKLMFEKDLFELSPGGHSRQRKPVLVCRVVSSGEHLDSWIQDADLHHRDAHWDDGLGCSM